MPIEFACESCSRLLRVPDGSAGSSCECPACKTLLEIPDPSAIGMVEVFDRSDKKLDHDRLEIPCPKCQFKLVCDPKLEGTKGQCRNCKYIFVITNDPQSRSVGQEAQSPGLVFNCPKCDQLFEGNAEMEGKKGKCHVCGEVFPIQLKPAEDEAAGQSTAATRGLSELERRPESVSRPMPSDAPASALTNKTAARRKPQAPKQQPAATQPPANIRITCGSCEGVMEVPGSAAGKSTACPYCQQLLEIPHVGSSGSPRTSTHASRPAPQKELEAASGFGDALANLDLGGNLGAPQTQWADLGDQSGAGNHYQPGAPQQGIDAWQAPKSMSRRGLTFGNVFSLTFEVLFPSCLMASLVYFMTSIASSVITYGSLFATGYLLRLSEVDFETAQIVVYCVLGIVVFVSILIGSASVCMISNGALHHVRKKRPDSGEFFSTNNAVLPMIGFMILFGLAYAAVALLPQGLNMILGPGLALITLLLTLLALLAFLVFASAVSMTPMAIIDGENPIDAMVTSFRIFMANPMPVIGVLLCGFLLYLGATVVTCGIGGLILAGLPFYLIASMYHLGTK